tara:strand:- start:145 stop:531 length:387 start_codon:yes stop_codon:yes gene_type:complete
MTELFEIKYHNSIFNVEICEHPDSYSYQTYVTHGSSGDLLMGGFETINECIDYIKSECKASSEHYVSEWHSMLEAYETTCFCLEDNWKNIPEGTMLNNIHRERLDNTYQVFDIQCVDNYKKRKDRYVT